MDIKLINDIKDIKPQWEKLLGQSDTATVFQSPSWVSEWQNYFVLGVYESSELIGIGVFEERDNKIIFGAMKPRWGNAYALADFGDIVAQRHREKEIWHEILTYFSTVHSALSIQLDFVRESSQSFEILKRLGQVKEQEVAPYIKIPRSWDIYLQSLPRKKRHELKRKMKKTEGELKIIEKISETDIDSFVGMAKGSSKEKRKFMDEKMADFFRKIVRLGKLFVLPRAMVLGFEYKNNWFLYNSGHKGGGAGVALFGMIIKEAIRRGIERVDFLRGSERYKYDLGAKDQKLYNISI